MIAPTLRLSSDLLRDPRSDIPELAKHVLGLICDRSGIVRMLIDQDVLDALESYPWDGPIFQMEQMLEQATGLSDGKCLRMEHLPIEVRSKPEAPSTADIANIPLRELEKMAIEQTLFSTGGNKAEAARRLGISEKSIYNKMKRLGLSLHADGRAPFNALQRRMQANGVYITDDVST